VSDPYHVFFGMRSLIAICAFVSLLTACKENCSCPIDGRHVYVKFTNNVSTPIDSIRAHIGAGNFGRGDVVMAFKDDLCVCFESPGENVFSVSALLSDGTVIVSKEYYSEGGYRFRAIMNAEGIFLENESNY